MFAPPKKNIFIGGGGDCSPAPPGSTPLGASDLDDQGGMCTVVDPGFAKKRGGAEKSVRVAHRVCAKRAPHTGGVQGPEALEFSANKGLQDGRQE